MFEQAKLKLRWVQERQLVELDRGLKLFAEQQPCEVLADHNPETKELRLQVEGDFVHVWPSLIVHAGVCAQTINSCLDYVSSEIVNTARHTDRRIVFPMNEDRDQLEASNSIKILRKVSPDLAAFILDEIKPTKLDNFPIWAVRNLANTDKHRNLLVAVHLQGFEVGWVKTGWGEMADVRYSGPDNDGYFSIPDVEEYRDAHPLIEIAFREPDLSHPNRFYRLEMLEFLANGANAVAEVISAVEQFLSPKAGEEV
jgi:hypothetical protein